MGLTYPLDIDAWAAWQKRQNTLRWAKGEARSLIGRLRGGAAEQEAPVGGVLYTRGAVPRVLIVLDSFSPTSRNSLLEPLKYLENVGVALWVPEDASEYLNGQYATERYGRDAWTEQEVTGDQLQGLLPGVRVVLSLGHYLARGAAAYEYSRAIGAEYWVVQHGLLVPQAPPLPVGCTLLAFSEADAQFWASGSPRCDHPRGGFAATLPGGTESCRC